MSLPPLPPHPTPIKAGLERFGVYYTRWAAIAMVTVVLFWAPARERIAEGPLPVGPQAPLQRGTTSAMDVLPFIGRAALAKLPPPAPNQLKAPCDPDLEEEINGYCWTPLAVERCPPEKACWTHNGKFYQRVLRVQRVPQSGEVRAGNVAGEP